MKILFKIIFLSLIITLVLPIKVKALTPGTLLYRTTADGKMFGYSKDPLLEVTSGVLTNINPGHVAIYIGQENGEDYVIEALAGGVVKTPAKYFVNEAEGEKFIGAKLPIKASALDRLKAIKIAKNLADQELNYDLDFRQQKGPGSGDWTCVGLTEKVYESANINNPNNIGALEYNEDYYAVDITPDGFDKSSFYNEEGDCFSTSVEFSKIARRENFVLPLPEKIGYNAGLEYQGDRYIFLPYTQFLQPSLRSERADINLVSSFSNKRVRGKIPVIGTVLRWSLINNPISSLKNIYQQVETEFSKLSANIFGKNNDDELIMSDDELILDRELADQQVATAIKINQSTEESNLKNEIQENIEVEKNVSLDQAVSQVKETKVSGIQNKEAEVPVNETLASIKVATADKPIGISSTNKSSNPAPISSLLVNSVAVAKSKMDQLPSKNITPSYNPNLALSKIISGLKPAVSSNTENSNSNNSSSNGALMTALITKIYATDNNDFIELYNPNDFDFDLAEAGLRLEKAKTADDPSLMIRLGNLADASYPGGTIIKAKGYYLIVRDDASSYFLNKADAIVTRNEFGWTETGYIIYLGTGALSSSSDEDIIDAVGFGAAKYFQGTAPAVEISDNYFLDRVSNLGDNSKDFILKVSSDPNIVWEDINNNNNPPSDNPPSDNPPSDDPPADDPPISELPVDFIAYQDPEPIVSGDVSHFWNFSECYGEEDYTVGPFDCAISVSFRNPFFVPDLTEEINLNQFSLSLMYRDFAREVNQYANIVFKLTNDSGQVVKFTLQPGMLQIDGLPNSSWRYYDANLMPDNNWHNFLLVVDKSERYWSVYIDGQEKYRHSFIETLANDFNYLEFSSDSGAVGLDELVLWRRSLSSEEILDNWQAQAPFAPALIRETQKPAELQYFWDFNEGYEFVNEGGGLKAVDSVRNLEMTLPANSWIWRGQENTGVISKWGNTLGVDLLEPLASKDLSLTFWWRSKFYPEEGRSLIILKHDEGQKLGLAPSHYRREFYYNDNYGYLGEGQDVDLPYDENWHHFALVYDSYRYKLQLFIDGQAKREMSYYWIKDGEGPNKLFIFPELNQVELDDLGVWEGSLTPLQVQEIYNNSRVAL